MIAKHEVHDGDLEIEETSGNVFADLGFAQPEDRMQKALLARAIGQVIKSRR